MTTKNSMPESAAPRSLKEIQAEFDKIDGSDIPSNYDFDRKNVYKAAMICADAIIIYANRCADLVEEMASREANLERKAEFTDSADCFRNSPCRTSFLTTSGPAILR